MMTTVEKFCIAILDIRLKVPLHLRNLDEELCENFLQLNWLEIEV